MYGRNLRPRVVGRCTEHVFCDGNTGPVDPAILAPGAFGIPPVQDPTLVFPGLPGFLRKVFHRPLPQDYIPSSFIRFHRVDRFPFRPQSIYNPPFRHCFPCGLWVLMKPFWDLPVPFTVGRLKRNECGETFTSHRLMPRNFPSPRRDV